MTAAPPKEPNANHASQSAPPANGVPPNHHSDELTLVKLFMELTGENESSARNAFMFVTGHVGRIAAVALAAIAIPTLVATLGRKADRERDRAHPSR